MIWLINSFYLFSCKKKLLICWVMFNFPGEKGIFDVRSWTWGCLNIMLTMGNRVLSTIIYKVKSTAELFIYSIYYDFLPILSKYNLQQATSITPLFSFAPSRPITSMKVQCLGFIYFLSASGSGSWIRTGKNVSAGSGSRSFL